MLSRKGNEELAIQQSRHKRRFDRHHHQCFSMGTLAKYWPLNLDHNHHKRNQPISPIILHGCLWFAHVPRWHIIKSRLQIISSSHQPPKLSPPPSPGPRLHQKPISSTSEPSTTSTWESQIMTSKQRLLVRHFITNCTTFAVVHGLPAYRQNLSCSEVHSDAQTPTTHSTRRPA